MLYSEFIEGTGCRDNDQNYKVYKDLEIMYVNSDMTKEQIYEYGKKLVNNEPSQEEKDIVAEWKRELSEHKEELARLRARKKEGFTIQKWYIDYEKRRIAELKFLLAI